MKTQMKYLFLPILMAVCFSMAQAQNTWPPPSKKKEVTKSRTQIQKTPKPIYDRIPPLPPSANNSQKARAASSRAASSVASSNYGVLPSTSGQGAYQLLAKRPPSAPPGRYQPIQLAAPSAVSPRIPSGNQYEKASAPIGSLRRSAGSSSINQYEKMSAPLGGLRRSSGSSSRNQYEKMSAPLGNSSRSSGKKLPLPRGNAANNVNIGVANSAVNIAKAAQAKAQQPAPSKFQRTKKAIKKKLSRRRN